MTAPVAAMIALGAPAAQALPSSTPDQSAFQPNGPVNAIARSGGITYIGGDFTRLEHRTGAFARLGQGSGTGLGSPEVTGGAGEVNATAPDGAGGFFIGGDFTHVGGVPRANIAHILPNGTLDPDFDPGADGEVEALAVSGSVVYAGGTFSNIGGKTRHRLAKLSATTGDAFELFNAQVDSDVGTAVDALAISGSALFVGGSFQTIGGADRDYLAKISTSTGDAFQLFGAQANNRVFALALSGTQLYVGGRFTQIGGLPRESIAKLSTTSGEAFQLFDAQPAGLVGSDVIALAATGDEVYAGGFFDEIGGRPREGLAKLSAATGNAFSAFDPDDPGVVFDIALSGGSVYVGGQFASIGGAQRSNVAKLSAASGNAFSGFDPNASSIVESLALSGTTVAAGGQFTAVNRTPRTNLAALDSAGRPTSWNPGAAGAPADDKVTALAVDGGAVYVGGEFLVAGGQIIHDLAKISAATGNAFTGWNPSGLSGFDPDAFHELNALAAGDGAVYLGGRFTDHQVGGQQRSNLVKLSAASGNAFSQWNPDPNLRVVSLALSGGSLYVGGEFDGEDSIGGEDRDHIAKLSTATGNAFSGFDPNADDQVRALAVGNSSVYAGGTFDTIGGAGPEARERVARLSLTSGSAFSFDPDANATVEDLAVAGRVVFAGGNFTQIGGPVRNRLAALSGITGDAFSTFNPNMNSRVDAVAADSQGVYAGGLFTQVGGRPREGFAQFSEP